MLNNINWISTLGLGLVLCSLFGQAGLAKPEFDRRDYFGEAVRDPAGKLMYIAENPKQDHAKDQYVFIDVTGFKINKKNENGRIRIAIWKEASNFADQDKKPFRAASFPVKEAVDGKMRFKVGGLSPDASYAYFIHFDENDDGILNRVFGIPKEPYMFSNKANQAKGPGIARVGLGAPKFEDTLVKYTGPGQIISLSF